MRRGDVMGNLAVLFVISLTGVALWKTRPAAPDEELVRVARRPKGVMGTTCLLAATGRPGEYQRMQEALDDAEAALRRVEAHMSTWLENSEISKLNAAAVGERVALSEDSLEVLAAARAAAEETRGAFDATCRPLIELWKKAGETGMLPTEEAIRVARGASNWDAFDVSAGGAVKSVASARVDFGGIAKGYGIDRALAAIEKAGALGGLVDVGGDLACFGESTEGGAWRVDVKDPFGDGVLGSLAVSAGSVCTSGNYARYSEIEGRRFSRIIDPRSGAPADAAASVTVLATDAMTADVWATALSVLGEEGLTVLPAGVHAMLVVGEKDGPRFVRSEGFPELVE